jgi:hypothetical protein
LYFPDQVAEENRRTFQDTNENYRLTSRIGSDLPAHFSDPGCNLLTRDQDFQFVHGRTSYAFAQNPLR